MPTVKLPYVNKSFGINGLDVSVDGDGDSRSVTLCVSGLPMVGRISIDLSIGDWARLTAALRAQGKIAFGGE